MGTADHTLTTADGPMRLYEATPDGPAKGAVIVVMEAFGVNDHIEDVTRRARGRGLPRGRADFFHRNGGGTVAYDDFGTVMAKFQGMDDGILVDVDAALDHLRAKGFADDQIGITGFCFGGRVTFLEVGVVRLGAGVTFYGGGIVKPGGLPFPSARRRSGHAAHPVARALRRPRQGHPRRGRRAAPRAEAAKASVPSEVVRYAEADHGFHCDDRPGRVPRRGRGQSGAAPRRGLVRHPPRGRRPTRVLLLLALPPSFLVDTVAGSSDRIPPEPGWGSGSPAARRRRVV